ncbi:MAG: hypothetical protein IJV05_04410 [Muribaculaceae bacterium]|nr:hypothetical protein [Muribaculaceae bacterium]
MMDFFSSFTSDTGVLLALALVTLLLMGVVGKKRGWLAAAIHAAVFLCYSCPLWYALIYRGDGGSSLVWLFYLLMAYFLHIIILLTTLVIACKSNRDRMLLVMLTVLAIVLFVGFCVLFIG